MKYKVQKYQYIIIPITIWLICFLPRVVVNMQVPLISIVSDEVSTMSAATMFTNMDWRSVISNAGYYGGGFTILFTPLFVLIEDSVLLYHIMIHIFAAVQAFVGVLAYIIIKRHTEITLVKYQVLLSVVASFLVTRRANSITNETPLILVCWIIVLILLELYEADRKKKICLSIMLPLVLCYALTLHTRALTMIAAFLVVYMCVLIIYKKSLVNLVAFTPTFIVAYFSAQYMVSYVQDFFFAVEEGEVLRNTEVNLSGVSLLLDISRWDAWFSLIMGPIGTVSMLTGGTIIVGAVVYFILVKKCLTNSLNVLDQKKLVVMTFTFASIVATILALSVSWLGGVSSSMASGIGLTDYALKGLTYIRYFGPYIGPFILMGIIYFGVNRIKKHGFTMGIISVIAAYFVFCVVPYLYANTAAKEAFVPFAPWTSVAKTSLFYVYGIIALVLISVALLLLSYYKKFTLLLCILCTYLGYQYMYSGICLDAKNSGYYSTEKIATYEALEGIREELPDNIYVKDGEKEEDADHQIYYTYQLLLKEYSINPGIPDEEEDEVIYITNTVDTYEDIFEDGYKLVVMGDDCEFVFVKGEEIEQLFIDFGFELVESY